METEATVHIRSPKLDNRELEKWSDESWFLQWHSNGLKHVNEFFVFKLPSQSWDLNPVEYFWDVVGDLRHGWTKISEECFLESIPQPIHTISGQVKTFFNLSQTLVCRTLKHKLCLLFCLQCNCVATSNCKGINYWPLSSMLLLACCV